jgi:lipopolysaccharide export system protein LptA
VEVEAGVVSGERLLAGLLCAAAVVAGSGVARAADVDIGERAGREIGRLAETVRDFRLTRAPADLQVEARTMEFDFKKGQLLYEGDVHVRHGEVKMDADRLQVTFVPKHPDKVEKIEASGRVRVLHQTETASGRLGIYDPGHATITLTGDARLGSGPNTVQGERVVVYLDEGRAVVEGGTSGPVRAYIEPKSDSLKGLGDREKREND